MSGLKHRPFCFCRFNVLFPLCLGSGQFRRGRVQHRLELGDFRAQLFTSGSLLRGGQLNYRFARKWTRVVDVVGVLLPGKESQEAVIVLLSKGIKLMVMAFGTSQSA